MSNREKRTISIVTSQQEKDVETMFPAPGALISTYSQVSYNELKKHLGDLVKTLSELVDVWPDTSGTFYVDQATFSLSINAAGKISLVGEVSAGLNSCITITLKRRSPST